MRILAKGEHISAFVKDILLLQSSEEKEHKLPFYADGYPGILFSETKKKIQLLPRDKQLSDFFLFGQTIEPIELHISGPYKLIVFQLFPFATRLLLEIDPKEINDECFDLFNIKSVDTAATVSKLSTGDNTIAQVETITDYLLELVKNSSKKLDNSIKMAVSTIIKSKGIIPIKDLRKQLYLTERTFERRFAREIGVSPKQFAKIIQFSFSLNQIKDSDYTKLTNVAYDNGFADQSHFIRTFKKYTGNTPRELLLQLN